MRILEDLPDAFSTGWCPFAQGKGRRIIVTRNISAAMVVILVIAKATAIAIGTIRSLTLLPIHEISEVLQAETSAAERLSGPALLELVARDAGYTFASSPNR